MRGWGRLGRPRHGMNRLEEAYAAYLTLRQKNGEIHAWWYEAWKFRLADRTYFTPDFIVQLPDGMFELHETKGYMRDDAAVKLKVTGEVWGCFPIYLVKQIKGGWQITPVNNGVSA